MSQIRCNGCRVWFDGFERVCPECGHKRPEYNSWLRTAQLNGHLNAEKARAIANR